MINYNQIPLLLERIQPRWLDQKQQVLWYRLAITTVGGLIFGLIIAVVTGSMVGITGSSFETIDGLIFGFIGGLLLGLLFGWFEGREDIKTVDKLIWDGKEAGSTLISDGAVRLIFGPFFGIAVGLYAWLNISPLFGLSVGLYISLFFSLFFILHHGLNVQQVDQTTRPEEKISFSVRNSFFIFIIFGLLFGLSGLLAGLFISPIAGLGVGLTGGLGMGLIIGMIRGGFVIIQHYFLLYALNKYELLPFRLIPFLDYCTDLIFLRRVGGGYIFVHRLLMEHFAAIYKEEESDQRIRNG